MKEKYKGPSRARWRRAFVFAGFSIAAALGSLLVHGGFLSARSAQRMSRKSTSRKTTTDTDGIGKQVWAGNCAGCHGLDGRGGERGPNIATNPEIAGLTDQEITRIVRDGSPNMAMPALGRTLDGPKIAAVVHHLRTLQGNPAASPLPGDPKAGETLYFGKAECSSCHMVAGNGGFIGQDLTDFARTRAADEIGQAIVRPANEPDPRAKTAIVFTRDGRKYLGVIRNEDNFSLQLETTNGVFHLFDRGGIDRVEYQKQSLMPVDYGSKLSAGEVNDIVSFLMATSRAHDSQKRGGEHKAWEDEDE
jgi:cytochrome c oxidase cbb3-type subunit 3